MLTQNIRLRTCVLAIACLALLGSSCSVLRDAEPFTQTLSLDLDQNDDLVVTPSEFTVDGRFGRVEVINNTETKRNFDIDELAVFEGIVAGKSKVVAIEDAEDNKTYRFYDHEDPDGDLTGKMIVRYRTEDER